MAPHLRHHPRHTLTIMAYNACGVKRQREELIQFLQEHKVDILLISESNLKPHMDFTLPNRTIYRQDRIGMKGGGVLIAISRDLPHYQLPTPNTNSIELVSVVLMTDRGTMAITSAYHPPGSKLLAADLDKVVDMHTPALTCGDLNAKDRAWGCHATTTSGTTLHDHSAAKGYEILAPDEPTHFPGGDGRPDILDLALLHDIRCATEIKTISALDSDHNPIFILIDTSTPAAATQVPQTRSVHWPIFNRHVAFYTKPTIPLNTTMQIDEAVANITNIIKEAKKVATTSTPTGASRVQIPAEILQTIARKNVVRRRWQRWRLPDDKRTYNTLTREVRAQLLEHRIRLWEESMANISLGTRGFYKFTRSRLRDATATHALHGLQGIVYSPADKAEVLADELERRFTTTDNDVMEDRQLHTMEREAAELLEAEPIQLDDLPTANEIRRIIRSSSAKAPGPDGIGNDDLKNLPRQAFALLIRIINACLMLQYFPDAWKTAKIVTFLKPGKRSLFPQNYRPISLLSNMAKILEKVIQIRITKILSDHNTLRGEQFGFRSHHSAPLQTLRLTEYIIKGFNLKRTTVAVFLDVKSAFDTVWHEALLYKLAHLTPITRPWIKIIASFLKNRAFYISLPPATSTKRPIEAGVPQGSVLSPMLYNIFMNDIPVDPHCNLAQYADDTAYYYHTRILQNTIKAIQRCLNNLEFWCKLWRITLNPEKTQTILFTKRRPIVRTNLFLLGTRLPWKNLIIYLGVRMDKRLTWHQHTNHILATVRQRAHKLFPMMNSKTLPQHLKLLLYRAYILPIMIYACATWGHIATCHLQRLQRFQNKTLRKISGHPWYITNRLIHAELDMLPIRAYMKKVAEGVYARILDAEGANGIILANIGNYVINPNWKHKMPKLMLLADDD